MKPLKISNDYTRLTDAGLNVTAQQIHDSMDGNANFPTPEPTLVVFEAALAAYSAALSNAQDGGKLEVAIKNQKKEELLDLLTQLADYVVFTSKGDRVKAISSGFTITKVPAPAPPVTKPESMRVENGLNSGELQTKVANVKGARSYVHQFTNDATLAEASWKTVACSSAQALIVNLQPGVKYYFRVGVIGSKMQLVYSDVVSRMAV